MGAYNTSHSLAFYVGGSFGGWLALHYGAQAVFALIAIMAVAWLGVSWGLIGPQKR